jgi:hypothetical protein
VGTSAAQFLAAFPLTQLLLVLSTSLSSCFGRLAIRQQHPQPFLFFIPPSFHHLCGRDSPSYEQLRSSGFLSFQPPSFAPSAPLSVSAQPVGPHQTSDVNILSSSIAPTETSTPPLQCRVSQLQICPSRLPALSRSLIMWSQLQNLPKSRSHRS